MPLFFCVMGHRCLIHIEVQLCNLHSTLG